MNTSTQPIICCGFTPCVQRILEFGLIKKGAVNRAKSVTLAIGGKGANTARMVHQLGQEVLLLGFSGGPNGALLEKMLGDEGVTFRHVQTQGETRICQTLVEDGHSETTELVEEMPPLHADEWLRMVELLEELDLTNSIVTVSGKLPAGAPIDAYAQIAQRVTKAGGKLILDAPGEPMLAALKYNPFLLKINDVELQQALGGEDLIDGCRTLIERGAQSVLITRGSRSALYMDTEQTLELIPPKIQAVNAVGSGDAVTAGIAVALAQRHSLHEMLIQGIACGAANALNLVSGTLLMEDVALLRRKVQISKFSGA
ncbi:MAG: hexose kinase [Lentisphaerae bacterium]|jgi:tagatose 6-phosphate kinase|nr:hexose kinase [Lentisphaerota bacterium]